MKGLGCTVLLLLGTWSWAQPASPQDPLPQSTRGVILRVLKSLEAEGYRVTPGAEEGIWRWTSLKAEDPDLEFFALKWKPEVSQILVYAQGRPDKTPGKPWAENLNRWNQGLEGGNFERDPETGILRCKAGGDYSFQLPTKEWILDLFYTVASSWDYSAPWRQSREKGPVQDLWFQESRGLEPEVLSGLKDRGWTLKPQTRGIYQGLWRSSRGTLTLAVKLRGPERRAQVWVFDPRAVQGTPELWEALGPLNQGLRVGGFLWSQDRLGLRAHFTYPKNLEAALDVWDHQLKLLCYTFDHHSKTLAVFFPKE